MSESTTTTLQREVRRCARCGKAAMVCVHAWVHRILGITTPTVTGEYRCQSCGEKMTLRPAIEIRVARIFGWVYLPAIFPGIFCLLLARRWSRVWADNPVVPDAPFPLVRWKDQPLHRRCALCGKHAKASKISQGRVFIGVSTGFVYTFQCEGCGCGFTINGARANLTEGVGVALAVGLAVTSFLFAMTPARRIGWGGAFSLIAVAAVWMMVSRSRAARRNPEIRQYES